VAPELHHNTGTLLQTDYYYSALSVGVRLPSELNFLPWPVQKVLTEGCTSALLDPSSRPTGARLALTKIKFNVGRIRGDITLSIHSLPRRLW